MVRAGLFALLVGCTESIAPGAYLCGEEQLCPGDLVCNGTDNVCVSPSQAQPFSCNADDNPDPQGDDDPATGQVVAGLQCVSGIRSTPGCLMATDPGDWYVFETPDNCTAVQVEARVQFPLAYEIVGLQLSIAGEAPQRLDVDCTAPAEAEIGLVARCFEMPLATATSHAVGVIHSGEGDCDGACRNNRYILQLRLATP